MPTMTVLRDQQFVEDSWQYVPDDAPATASKVILPLARWLSLKDSLPLNDGQQIGVLLQPEDPLATILGDLNHLACIALAIPVFKDGRPYTTARLLRERYGYHGTIRATGDVLVDQLFYLHRVGFDTFELRQDQNKDDALAAFTVVNVLYQPAADESRPLYLRR